MILVFRLSEINVIMEDMTLSNENILKPILFGFNNFFLIGPHIGQELMPWTKTLIKMHDSQKTCLNEYKIFYKISKKNKLTSAIN